MRLAPGTRVHRLLSLLLLGTLAMFFAEETFADVHDGDAPPAIIAAATIGEASPALPAPVPPSAPAEHGPHVCHCTHSHLGWAPLALQLSAPSVAIATMTTAVDDHPTDGVHMPALRPPIL